MSLPPNSTSRRRTGRRGAVNIGSTASPPMTRSRSAINNVHSSSLENPANQQEDPNSHFSDSATGAQAGAYPNIPEDMVTEVFRAQQGLDQIQVSRRSENGNVSSESVSASQVQKMIEESMQAQTERLTAMFNRVVIDQLSAFRTPPHSFGVPSAPFNENVQRRVPPQFNDSSFENNLPRPSAATGLAHNSSSNEAFSDYPPSGQGREFSRFQVNQPAVQFNIQRNTPANEQEVSMTFQNPRPTQARLDHAQVQQNTYMIPNPTVAHHPSETREGGHANSQRNPLNNPRLPQDRTSQSRREAVDTTSNFPDLNVPHNYAGYYPPNMPFVSKRGLHDWDLKYDGSTSVERFIVKVDILRKANNLSWPYVVSQFHCLIKKPADRWYWSWMSAKQRDEIIVTWDLLREALISHFGSAQTDEDITRLLNDKRQKPSEKFAEFFEEFMTIHDALKTPKNDQELITILKRNISNRLFQLTYNISAPDVDSFRVKVLRVENDLERRYSCYSQKFKDGNRINELDQEEVVIVNEECINVDEVRMNGNSYRDNNRTRNSVQRESKDLYCYRCGNPGYTVPNCPKCQCQENSQ